MKPYTIIPHSVITSVMNSEKIELGVRVFIAVLYLTGCRISEACLILASDLRRKDSSIVIRGLKDGYERAVPVPPSLFLLLEEYWKRYNRPFDKGAKLFPCAVGSWRMWCAEAFRQVGVKMTPHALRHSRATYLMNSGAPVPLVQGFLGHKSILSTAVYTHYALEPMRSYLEGRPSS